MKKLTGFLTVLTIASTSLMAWNYPSTGTWQYPPSWSQGCPQEGRPTYQTPMWPQTRPTSPAPTQQPQSQPGPQRLEQQHANLVVMFTRDNCPYCQYMLPIMKQAESKFGQDIKFLFIDVRQYPQYASQYGFTKVPHIVYFKDGQKVDAHGSNDKTMTIEQVEARVKNLQAR